MFSLEYDFYPRAGEDHTAFVENHLFAYLADLLHTGQILAQPWNVISVGDAVRCSLLAPEADSLAPQHHSQGGRAAYASVLAASSQPPEVRSLGPTLGLPSCCDCRAPGTFVLFTTFLDDGPPVHCFDCRRPVPLYRVPHAANQESHHPVRAWASGHRACDTLFMGSGIGERWGYEQVARLESELTHEGRGVCSVLEAAIGKPVYYFLDCYYPPQAERCPGFGSEWERPGPPDALFSYRCTPCRLLSTEPTCL